MSRNGIRIAFILLCILSIDFFVKKLVSWILKKITFIHLLYHKCANAQGYQKRTLNSLELDLEAVVRHSASAKNQILIFFKSNKYSQTISSAHGVLFLWHF